MLSSILTSGTLYIDRDKDLLTNEWGKYIKIGIVRNEREAQKRTKEHQTGNPRLIEIIYSTHAPMVENLETQLHQTFALNRVLGEWFLFDDRSMKSQVIPLAEEIICQQNEIKEFHEERLMLKEKKSSGNKRLPKKAEKTIHKRLVNLKSQLIIEDAKQKILKNYLIALSKNKCGIEGTLYVQRRNLNPLFDKKKFKKDHPKLYKKYSKEDEQRVTGSIIMSGTKSLKNLDSALHRELILSAKSSKLSADSHKKKPAIRTPKTLNIHREYLENMSNISQLNWEIDCLTTKLVCMLGHDDEIEGLISWKRTIKKQTQFSSKLLFSEYPELYNQYSTQREPTLATVVAPMRPYQFSI